MAKVIIEDLDQELIERLEGLAKERGRSLQAELKQLLDAAAEAASKQSFLEGTANAKTPEELGWPPSFFEGLRIEDW